MLILLLLVVSDGGTRARGESGRRSVAPPRAHPARVRRLLGDGVRHAVLGQAPVQLVDDQPALPLARGLRRRLLSARPDPRRAPRPRRRGDRAHGRAAARHDARLSRLLQARLAAHRAHPHDADGLEHAGAARARALVRGSGAGAAGHLLARAVQLSARLSRRLRPVPVRRRLPHPPHRLACRRRRCRAPPRRSFRPRRRASTRRR